MMKRFVYFFPYILTNMAMAWFFVMLCFLVKDTYFNPSLKIDLDKNSFLFIVLLIFFIPRYLIKGAIPYVFQKGMRYGFLFIAKNMLVWAVGFFLWTFHESLERVSAIYQLGTWYLVFLVIFYHYVGERGLKKADKRRAERKKEGS